MEIKIDDIKKLARKLIETSEYYKELENEYTEEVIFEKAMEEAEEILIEQLNK